MDWLPPYPLLLVLHLGAVAVFGSMTLLVAVTLAAAVPDSVARRDELRRLDSMNRIVALPALAFVWLLGLALATKGGWFGAIWLHAKIAAVVAVSALHLLQSRRLHRLAGGRPAISSGGWRLTMAIATLLIVIIALVSAKPD